MIADNEAGPVVLDIPWWRKPALLSHRCQRVPRCTALNTSATPTTHMIMTAQVMVIPPIYASPISATRAQGSGRPFAVLVIGGDSSHNHLRQPRDTRRDCSRLLFAHEIARMAVLRREIDIRYGKVVGVAYDVGDAAVFFDCPRLWKSGTWAFV